MPNADASSISAQSTHGKSLSKELQEENKQEMLDRKEDLVFVSPLLRGFALKNKLWRKIPHTSSLSPCHTKSYSLLLR